MLLVLFAALTPEERADAFARLARVHEREQAGDESEAQRMLRSGRGGGAADPADHHREAQRAVPHRGGRGRRHVPQALRVLWPVVAGRDRVA
jgi:hypothetical protein